MGNVSKSKEQIIGEIEELRQMIDEFQETDGGLKKLNDQLKAEIDDRKQVEKNLQESEERYRLLYERSPLGYQSLDADGNLIEVNPAWISLLGYEKEEVIGRSFAEFLASGFPELFKERFPCFKAAGEACSVPFEMICKDGKHIHVEIDGKIGYNPDGSFKQTHCIVRDITERKRAEKALRESEDKFRTLTGASPVGVFQTDIKGNCIYVNDRWCEIAGMSLEQATGQGWAESLYEKDREAIFKSWYEFAENGEEFSLEYRFQTPDGKVTWVYGHAEHLLDDQGATIGYIGTITDITKRRQAEKALKESDERFRHAVMDSPFPIMIHADDGEVLQINNVWTELTGYLPEEIPTLADWTKRAYGEKKDIVKSRIDMIFDCDARVEEGEYVITAKDGNRLIWDFSSAPLSTLPDGRRVVISTAVDVTLRKKVEESLMEGEKRFRLLMQQSPSVIELYDIDGLQIEVNKAYEVLWDFPASHTVNQFNILKSKEVEDTGLMHYVKKAYAGQAVVVPEYKFDSRGETEAHGQGRVRWLSTRIYPLKDKNGNVTNIVITHEDITKRKQAEEEVRQAKDRYDRLTDNADEAIFRVNAIDGGVVYTNTAAERIFGYSQEEWLADKSLGLKIIHPDYRDRQKEILEEIVARKETIKNVVLGWIAKDGRKVIVEYTIIPILGKDGEILYFESIGRDITDRKRAESEREITIKLLRLLNDKNNLHELIRLILCFMKGISGCEAVGIRLRDGDDFPYYETSGFSDEFIEAERYLCVSDLNGQLQRDEMGNPMLECMCGNIICGRFDPSKTFFTDYGSFISNCTSELLASTIEEDRQSRTRNRCNADGYESVLLIPLRAAGETFGLMQFNDHRKGCFSPQFITLAECLAGNVAIALAQRKAGEELEIAKQKAEAANVAKSQFLANMSHEIRSPMSMITGFAELLNRDELTDEQRSHSKLILKASKALLKIIDDILDVSRIEAGKLELNTQQRPLTNLLDSIEQMMEQMANEKKLQFEVYCSNELPTEIYTDHDRLHQCLVNLISNAVKFTEKGHVHLNVTFDKRQDKDFVRFDVEDTGIGIAAKDHEKIFSTFRQVDGSDSQLQGGTGLGLAITKQLVELLDGEITLTSEVGKGSVFSLIIPTGVRSEPEDAIDENKGESELEKKTDKFSGKVLVAEDIKGSQILIKTHLNRLGLDVTIAEDGKKAIEEARGGSYDMILMDIRMPGLDGYETTRRLRKQGVTTPIIALTAYAMIGDKEKCLEAGCDDYLSKPIEHEKLLKILSRFLNVKPR